LGPRTGGSGESAWVNGDAFGNAVGLAIAVSIAALWGETDEPDVALWTGAEVVCLGVFVFELCARLVAMGASELCFGQDCLWIWLDALVVGCGAMDLGAGLLCRSATAGGRQSQHSLCPVRAYVRLTRLLRLLRVFKLFPRLMAFMTALRGMLMTSMWLIVLVVMLMLTLGITLTRLFGRGVDEGDERFPGGEPASPSARDLFRDVPTSVFTLFQLMTIDNWEDIARPLVEINPWWRLFFVLFIGLAAWTVLSVLTAVASNNMILATVDRKESEAKEQERKYEAFVEFLKECFKDADIDGNNSLDRNEFDSMIKEDFVHSRMKELGVHLSHQELSNIWDMLDIDESGELTIDEFVTGLSTLQEGLSTKHMVALDYSLKRVTLKAERTMDRLCEKAESLMLQSAELHHHISQRDPRANEAALQQFAVWLQRSDFGRWAATHGTQSPTPSPPSTPVRRDEST